MSWRPKLFIATLAALISFSLVASAASSPSLIVFTNSGVQVQTFPEIEGTECWDAGDYVVAPEGVPFEACTPAPPTTTEPPPPTTTEPPPPTTEPPAEPVASFVERFDTPASLDRFDFAVHHAWTANATDNAWPGDHDLQCGGANTQRLVENPTVMGRTYFPGLVEPTSYWCKEHLMTSFNTNHYAQVDFAPKDVFEDVTEVCWDQNRTLMSKRHWTQLVVVPLDTFEAHGGRLDYVASRFSPDGPGKYGIHPTDETLLIEFGEGKPRVQIGQAVDDPSGLAWNAGSDRMTRFKHCVRDTGSGLEITIDAGYGLDSFTETFHHAGGIPDGPVKVVLQHDLYNPDKATVTPNAYTVHWDNVEIE